MVLPVDFVRFVCMQFYIIGHMHHVTVAACPICNCGNSRMSLACMDITFIPDPYNSCKERNQRDY